MRGYESKKSALQISGHASSGTIKQNLSKENRLARRTAKKQMTAEEYERYIAVVNRYKELKEEDK